MQIHMVIRTSKPMDEWVNTNLTPYLSKAKAEAEAKRLTKTLTEEQKNDYMEYVVESYEIAA